MFDGDRRRTGNVHGRGCIDAEEWAKVKAFAELLADILSAERIRRSGDISRLQAGMSAKAKEIVMADVYFNCACRKAWRSTKGRGLSVACVDWKAGKGAGARDGVHM